MTYSEEEKRELRRLLLEHIEGFGSSKSGICFFTIEPGGDYSKEGGGSYLDNYNDFYCYIKESIGKKILCNEEEIKNLKVCKNYAKNTLVRNILCIMTKLYNKFNDSNLGFCDYLNKYLYCKGFEQNVCFYPLIRRNTKDNNDNDAKKIEEYIGLSIDDYREHINMKGSKYFEKERKCILKERRDIFYEGRFYVTSSKEGKRRELLDELFGLKGVGWKESYLVGGDNRRKKIWYKEKEGVPVYMVINFFICLDNYYDAIANWLLNNVVNKNKKIKDVYKEMKLKS